MRKKIFLTLEALIALAFLYLDFIGRWTWGMPLKYSGILLCLLFSLGGEWRLTLAMALTAVADLFLLVLDSHYFLGVAVFCCVQALYLWQIRRCGGWSKICCIAVRIALVVACLSVVWAAGLMTPLTALSALYFSQLLGNAAESWSVRCALSWRFPLGLTLFVFCDICVGLHNLPTVGETRPIEVILLVTFAMWVFYLPSQILLALSAHAGRPGKSNREELSHENQ